MTIDIFKSFQEAINAGIFVFIIGLIVILIFIIIRIKEWYDYREDERKHKEEIQRNIDKIIEASRKWSIQEKINNANNFLDHYERLLECQKKPVGAGYATETVITVFVNGKLENFEIDINGLYTLYRYMKNEVEGR